MVTRHASIILALIAVCGACEAAAEDSPEGEASSSEALSNTSFDDGRTTVIVAHNDDEVLWFQPFLTHARTVVQAFGGTAPAQRDAQRNAYGASWTTAKLRHAYPDYPTNEAWITDFGERDRCERDRVFSYDAIKARVEPYVADPGVVRIITHNHWGEYGHAHHRTVSAVVRELAVKHKKNVWIPSFVRTNRATDDPNGTLYRDKGDLFGLRLVSVSFSFPEMDHARRAFQAQAFKPGVDTWTWHDGRLDYPHGTRQFVKIVDAKLGDLTGTDPARLAAIQSIRDNEAPLYGSCGAP